MRYALLPTEYGTLAVGFDDVGITRVVLPESDWKTPSKAQLQRAGFKTLAPAPAYLDDLRAHLSGRARSLAHLPLSEGDFPPFLLRVLRASQTIPLGETRTYGELAGLVGSPGASRAVGTAMSTNRWPIVVPCHRVFASTGPGAYSAGQGVHTKLRLLWREGYRGRTSNVAFSTEEARAHLLSADPLMARLVERAGPFTVQLGKESPFAALASSIVYQQLTGKAAGTIHARVVTLLGEMTPAQVLRAKKADLRAAGLSENKALSLIDLAKKTESGVLPLRKQMDKMDDEALLEAMSAVRGIGRWSGQMLLMFYLGRPNVLPVLDLGVRKGFQNLRRMKALPADVTLEKAAQAWAPYRSVASWYLWRATEIPGTLLHGEAG